MALLARSNNGGFFRRNSKLRRLPGVVSTTELEREFERERSRVDRNSSCFSVAVFLQEDNDEEALAQLAIILVERSRTPDLIGRLDTERLAALLPDTGSAGAWSFADDVTRSLAELKLKFDCLVHTYPADPESPDDDGGSRVSGSNAPEQERAQPTIEQHKSEQKETRKPAAASAKGQENKPRLVEEDDREVACAESKALRAHVDRPVADLAEHFKKGLPIWKRSLDIFVSTIMIIVLAPLLLVTALVVKFSSPGPIIFKQVRAGHGGKPFTIYKFRSMYVDAEERRAEIEDLNELDGPVFKIRNDPRMSPVGRLLRRMSIDELPQLWNVLIGDMTLVGPRPPMLTEIADYEQWQLSRLDLKGGLTCIWQVSGRSEIGFEDWIRMDLKYVKTRTWLGDLELLGRTAKAVISGRGAF